MTKSTIQLYFNPSTDLIDSLSKQLKTYNESKIGSYQKEFCLALAHDPEKKLEGGICGYFQFGWLYIDILWVDKSKRYHGLGAQLLQAFEKIAIDRNIFRIRLNTGSFQAPNFYLKHGYEIFAKLDITAPDGSQQIDYFLKKELQKP